MILVNLENCEAICNDIFEKYKNAPYVKDYYQHDHYRMVKLLPIALSDFDLQALHLLQSKIKNSTNLADKQFTKFCANKLASLSKEKQDIDYLSDFLSCVDFEIVNDYLNRVLIGAIEHTKDGMNNFLNANYKHNRYGGYRNPIIYIHAKIEGKMK